MTPDESLNYSLQQLQGIGRGPAASRANVPYSDAERAPISMAPDQQLPGRASLHIDLSVSLGVSNFRINFPLPLGEDTTESLAHFEALIAFPTREILRTMIAQYFTGLSYAMGQDHEVLP